MPSQTKTAVTSPAQGKIKSTFDTLQRQHTFSHPSTTASEVPALQAAIQPHIDSFNAITSERLLEAAVRDTGRKTIFDHKSEINGGRGNKLAFWLEDVQLSRPALSSRERTSLNRRLYPAEVGTTWYGSLLICRVGRGRRHTREF
jgi:DNA-directed RNA polymerase I subunit RPA2